MTGIASRIRSSLTLVALTCAIVAIASVASAQQVAAKAQVVKVVENGDFIDVQLNVSVTNNDSSVASNVFVLFEDGLVVGLGDVARGQSAVSQTQSLTIDVSSRPTRHVPVPVKVTFDFKGKHVEQAQVLIVNRATAPERVQ